MNRIFDWIDKYKFGLIATVAGYIFIFSYLQMSSYTKHFPISPFQDGPEIVDEEIPLDPEQIEVPENYSGDLKNIARDRNDQREKSNDDWSENPPMDGEAYAKAVEQSYKDETGGEAKRAEIREQYEKYKQEQADKKKRDEQNKKNNPNNSNGGDKQYGGNVMVDWSLSGRKQSRLPIPGYMCGKGASGRIVMDVSVNQNGNVLSARFNSGSSTNSNYCMVEQARKYAMKSRFNYSGSASKTQSGQIIYTFISQ